MSKEWYIASGGSCQEGPLTPEEILARLEKNSRNSRVLVWRPGFDDWKEVREPSEFLTLDHRTPPVVPDANNEVERQTQELKNDIEDPCLRVETSGEDCTGQESAFFGGRTHPWRRFFARFVDTTIFAVFLSFVLGYLIAKYAPDLFEGYIKLCSNILVASILFYIPWLPIEALFLSRLGATPGKWCFGISVKMQDGSKPDYGTALSRAFQVWVKGEGLGVPLAILITRVFAYSRLTKSGATSWDEACETVVHHKKWGIGRVLACVVLVSFIVMVLSALRK